MTMFFIVLGLIFAISAIAIAAWCNYPILAIFIAIWMAVEIKDYLKDSEDQRR